MRIIVLGAAAGGGFPQWNCACANCARARRGDPAALPRSQCGLAVTADGRNWFLLNASPDLRQQLVGCRPLAPREGVRQSPIAGVLLTGAEVDGIAGLLALREGHCFTIFATGRTLDALHQSRIFDALAPGQVERRPVELDAPFDLPGSDGGLTVTLVAVPGKAPLYSETEEAVAAIGSETQDTVAIQLSSRGRTAWFIPGCAGMTPHLADRLRGADLVLFDGTLWTDDEMVRLGLGQKTGRRMGHMSIDGPGGSLESLADLEIERKIFVHINNSNPILIEDSSERATANARGWEVAFDGMEITV